jgi:hypothetical protein
MISRDKAERLISQAGYQATPSMRERILARIDRARADHSPQSNIRTGWSAIGPCKVAAAALVLVALMLSLYLLDGSTRPAYGLAQTFDAVREIRYFHFQAVRPDSGDKDREAWVEYDPSGQIKNIRVNFYQLHEVAVWSGGVTQYWRTNANALAIFEDQEYTDRMVFFAQRYNPRGAIEYLRQKEAAGEVKIETAEQDPPTEPITMTVTYEPNTFIIGQPKPAMKEVVHIDPLSKLITDVEVHAFFKEHGFVKARIWQYLDYNQPFGPGTFDLASEAPADVNLVDLTGIPMGIERGDCTEQEVAEIVVQEFLDAWMVGDLDKAIRIHGYMDPCQPTCLQKGLQYSRLKHLITLGQAQIPEHPRRGQLVFCTLEVERKGQTVQVDYEFLVNEGPKGRWRIREYKEVKPPDKETP